jgi:hypothetical protein
LIKPAGTKAIGSGERERKREREREREAEGDRGCIGRGGRAKDETAVSERS